MAKHFIFAMENECIEIIPGPVSLCLKFVIPHTFTKQ
jgi:hypothetical protein